MENTAKNFALQIGALVTLYVSLGALISLLFAIITVAYPDAVNGYWETESAQRGIRMGIALLVVFFPAYLYLTRIVNSERRRDEGKYLSLTKWLIYLSLVVGGGVLLGDLVAVINEYLNGELTVRFMLKAAVILVSVGSAFLYYLFDARQYWHTHEKESIRVGITAFIVVVAALTLGFKYTEAPSEVREARIDAQQINDLSLIQSRIEEYYYVNYQLPESLEVAFQGLTGTVASADRSPYVYRIVNDVSYELCAQFVTESTQMVSGPYSYPSMNLSYSWDHGSGNWCFTRLVTDTPRKPY